MVNRDHLAEQCLQFLCHRAVCATDLQDNPTASQLRDLAKRVLHSPASGLVAVVVTDAVVDLCHRIGKAKMYLGGQFPEIEETPFLYGPLVASGTKEPITGIESFTTGWTLPDFCV
jgi:hypothetical protein